MADDTIAKIGIDVDVTGAEEAGSQLDKLGKKGKKTEGNLNNLAKGANKTNGPFRAMRGSMQQVSWQLQDVAVQAQMGTSYFTILGQQGPQLASIFGPGGAVVGAIVAFGAMIGGVLFSSLTGTKDAVKDLDDAMDSLKDRFDELGPAARAYQIILSTQEIKKQKQIELDKKAELARMDEIRVTGVLSAVIKELTRDLDEEAITRARLNAEIEESQNIQRQHGLVIDNLTTSTQELTESLVEELIILQVSEEQLYAYRAAQAGATKEQAKIIVALFKKIAAQKEANKAEEDKQKLLDKAIEDQKKAKEELASYSEGLYHQLAALHLSGDALYYYQAALKGGTAEQIAANAELLKSIALRKQQIKADADAAKAKAKAEADALKRGDAASSLLEEIALENMSELEQLEAHLIKKGGLLFQYLQEGHLTLDQYLAMDAELRATYDAAELLAKKEKNDKLLESDKAYADAKASLDNQVLASASGLAGDLANAAEEGSNAQKALFAIQKAIAIATTIVNTEMAAIAAVAPPPIGLGPVAGAPYSFAIRAMGYASAGIIAGTAIAGGRALGGQVRGGESYLVGERGPELLTMGTSGRIATNENLKNAVGGNSGSAVTVNQTINVTTGIQSTVRAEIVTLMPQIAQAAKGAVADARLRGGNFSKAMSGA